MPTNEQGERRRLECAVAGRRRGLGAILRAPAWLTALRLAGLAGLVYLQHDGPVAGLDREVAACISAYDDQRWQAADDHCARAVARTGDPAAGVRAAAALLRTNRSDQALEAARRWFGSREDATAQQIAGAVYLDRNDLDRAIQVLEHALAGHVALADHVEASRDHSYAAGAYLHAGRLGDALAAAQGAVREAALTSPTEAHAQLRGRAQLKVGKLLTEIGDAGAARVALWDAQQALAAWPVDQAWVTLELGLLAKSVLDAATAVTLFERALKQAVAAQVPTVATAARLNLAYALQEVGQLDAAARVLGELDPEMAEQPTALFIAGLIAGDRGDRRLSDQLLARAAQGAPTDDYAMDIAAQRGQLAERAHDADAAERLYRQAIDTVEKLRGATDTLGLRPLILARRQAPYRKLVALLARQDRRFGALVVAEQLHARSWRDALVAHTGADGVVAQVASAQALGRQLEHGVDRELAIDEVLAIARGREILVFADAGSDLWRFHLVDGSVDTLARVAPRARELIERWHASPGDLELARELGELLIPARARRPSARPLYVVALGELGDLPFAALRPGGRFLVESRVLSRLPGLVALRCPAHQPHQRSTVLIGDSRDDLPAARRETLALAELLGSRARLGPDATVEQLESSRDAALLHLAVHAEVDRAGARLVLAGDRRVSAAEIVARDIGPRVAVLAGCATAVGRDPEGWNALASAFLAAGSRSVVATLQSVDDRDTSELMRRYYLAGGDLHPALALATVQREQIAAGGSAWRAFVAYGSAEPADCAAAP